MDNFAPKIHETVVVRHLCADLSEKLHNGTWHLTLTCKTTK